MPKRFSTHCRAVVLDHQGLVALARDVSGVLVANLPLALPHMSNELRTLVVRQLGLVLVLAIALFSASSRWSKREGAAGVDVGGGRVRLAGEKIKRTLRMSRWRAALDPGRHGDVVLVDPLGDRVVLPMRAEADDCLVALGAQQPGQASFWLGASPPAFPVALLWIATWIIAWATSSQGMPLVSVALSLLVALVAQRWLAPRQPMRLVIGDDGLLLDSWRERSFVPYRDLIRCDVSEAGLVLEQRDGAHMDVPCKLDARAVLRIQDEIRLRGDVFEHAAAPAEPLLERGDRSLSEWRESLGALRAQPGDYRSQSLDEPTLHTLMTDPTASAEQRLGAALALSATPAERRRIRVAARACLELRMRVALEKIARDDASDEVLAEALDEPSSTGSTRAR